MGQVPRLCNLPTKLRHYRNLYVNRPDSIPFLPTVVETLGRLYDDFIRLIFLHVHRETSVLSTELPEESDQFRFLREVCFTNLKGAVGLIMTKASAMRISIPLDLSSRTPLLILPSYFFLCVLPKRHILSIYLSLSLAFVLIIVLAWHLSSVVVYYETIKQELNRKHIKVSVWWKTKSESWGSDTSPIH